MTLYFNIYILNIFNSFYEDLFKLELYLASRNFNNWQIFFSNRRFDLNFFSKKFGRRSYLLLPGGGLFFEKF